MIRFLAGMLAASLAVIAWHIKIQYVVYDLFHRGDTGNWGDVAKQVDYRYFNGGKA